MWLYISSTYLLHLYQERAEAVAFQDKKISHKKKVASGNPMQPFNLKNKLQLENSINRKS